LSEEFSNKIERCFQTISKVLEEGRLGKEQGYALLKYGSTVNGLASRTSSDLDLTILCRHDDAN